MLELLHIENIAIIERADILFGRGFNALTGEPRQICRDRAERRADKRLLRARADELARRALAEHRAIDALKMDEAEKARRVDMLYHQIGELERADLQEGEEETLLARRNILRNGEKFISAISEADACLNGGDTSSTRRTILSLWRG